MVLFRNEIRSFIDHGMYIHIPFLDMSCESYLPLPNIFISFANNKHVEKMKKREKGNPYTPNP